MLYSLSSLVEKARYVSKISNSRRKSSSGVIILAKNLEKTQQFLYISPRVDTNALDELTRSFGSTALTH